MLSFYVIHFFYYLDFFLLNLVCKTLVSHVCKFDNKIHSYIISTTDTEVEKDAILRAVLYWTYPG